jgi:hypothetical protein
MQKLWRILQYQAIFYPTYMYVILSHLDTKYSICFHKSVYHEKAPLPRDKYEATNDDNMFSLISTSTA